MLTVVPAFLLLNQMDIWSGSPFKIFYWGIVGLQCCVSFRYTQSESYIYMIIHYVYVCLHIHPTLGFFSHRGHYRVSSRVPWAIYSMYFYFIYSNVHMSFPISQFISSLHDLLCLEQFKVSETKRCLRFYSPGEER